MKNIIIIGLSIALIILMQFKSNLESKTEIEVANTTKMIYETVVSKVKFSGYYPSQESMIVYKSPSIDTKYNLDTLTILNQFGGQIDVYSADDKGYTLEYTSINRSQCYNFIKKVIDIKYVKQVATSLTDDFVYKNDLFDVYTKNDICGKGGLNSYRENINIQFWIEN